MIDVDLLTECLRHQWPVLDPSKPDGYRGGPLDLDAPALAQAIAAEYDSLLLHEGSRAPRVDGPPPECPPGKHDWYVHEFNTPCYGVDGEIYLPPGTIHCRSCFKVKGARRRSANR